MKSATLPLLNFVGQGTRDETLAMILANVEDGFTFDPLPTVTVTTTAAEILSKKTTPRKFYIFNNGVVPIWIQFGTATPIADAPSPTGNGYGIRIPANGLYETPASITSAVKAVTYSGTAKVTIIEAHGIAAVRVNDCRAVCPST